MLKPGVDVTAGKRPFLSRAYVLHKQVIMAHSLVHYGPRLVPDSMRHVNMALVGSGESAGRLLPGGATLGCNGRW